MVRSVSSSRHGPAGTFHDRSRTPAVGARILRVFAFLLLIAQFGLVAHQIEHYLTPETMECGEDSCAAFAPTTGASALPILIAPFVYVVFFSRFWTVNQASIQSPSDRLGFRAHAPPV